MLKRAHDKRARSSYAVRGFSVEEKPRFSNQNGAYSQGENNRVELSSGVRRKEAVQTATEMALSVISAAMDQT